MSIIRSIIKVIAIIVLLFFLVYLYFRLNTKPHACPRMEHVFLGEKYDIERCSGGGGDAHYNVWLYIYSKDNELLATRSFSVWTEPNSKKMEYRDDSIVYTNAIIDYENGVPEIETKVLQFPLTRRDWFEANLDRILFSP